MSIDHDLRYPDDRTHGADPPPEASLVSLVTMLLRRRALIVWTTMLLAIVFTGFSLVGDRTWTSVVSFFPQGKKSGGNLSALAAQFGVPVGAADANESPSFYADLVKSRAVLGIVADSGVSLPPDTRRVDVAEVFDIKTTAPALRRDQAIKKLNGAIAVSTNAKTGVVTMRVSSTSAQFSAAIGTRLLDLLDRFNQDTRRGQASAERKFTEERLSVVKKELREAEDVLLNFLQVNRVIVAPQLRAQQDRLEREVSVQQELYTNLAKAFEQAKIDEVRDTPVITVVERPELAARPDSRGIVMKAVASTAVGFILGAVLALILEGFGASSGMQNAQQDEFRRLSSATLRDLRKPWRLLRSVKA